MPREAYDARSVSPVRRAAARFGLTGAGSNSPILSVGQNRAGMRAGRLDSFNKSTNDLTAMSGMASPIATAAGGSFRCKAGILSVDVKLDVLPPAQGRHSVSPTPARRSRGEAMPARPHTQGGRVMPGSALPAPMKLKVLNPSAKRSSWPIASEAAGKSSGSEEGADTSPRGRPGRPTVLANQKQQPTKAVVHGPDLDNDKDSLHPSPTSPNRKALRSRQPHADKNTDEAKAREQAAVERRVRETAALVTMSPTMLRELAKKERMDKDKQVLMDMFASCKESGHVRQTTYDNVAQAPRR
mmetsp:Transcript_68098/g.161475  ORF Transcript_68098/g.161475 Transcript_68098/m.161475 type:complete len:299 (+) Transcript_68098:107-1003(+)